MKDLTHVLTYRINGEIFTIKSKLASTLEEGFKKVSHLTDYHLFTLEEVI